MAGNIEKRIISIESAENIQNALEYGDLEMLMREISYYLHLNNLKLKKKFISSIEDQGLIVGKQIN